MSDNYLRVSRCSIIWSQRNIRDSNNTITVDRVEKQIPVSDYSFSELQDFLQNEYKITIKKLIDNHIELTSEKDLNPKNFGSLLGFAKDKAIVQNTKTKSDFQAEMTNGLREISVFCPSLVKEYKNYSYDLILGIYKPSSLLIDLNIDSTQKLNGTITNFALDIMKFATVLQFQKC